MFSNIPIAYINMISDVPPELMNGSVIPVDGSIPTTTAMFVIAWKNIIIVMPLASR